MNTFERKQFVEQQGKFSEGKGTESSEFRDSKVGDNLSLIQVKMLSDNWRRDSGCYRLVRRDLTCWIFRIYRDRRPRSKLQSGNSRGSLLRVIGMAARDTIAVSLFSCNLLCIQLH